MKKYFAKYLPVDGEIKIGDKIRSESISSPAVTVIGIADKGDYITDEQELADPFGGSYYVIKKEKAVKLGKLFLCSRDIQVGDKVINKSFRNEFDEFTVVERPEGYNLDFHIGIYTDGTLMKEPAYLGSPFKIIGEISPDALEYVKEGDEFDEEQIGYQTHIYEDGFDNDKETYFNPIYKDWRHTIGIKGPCGHFH